MLLFFSKGFVHDNILALYSTAARNIAGNNLVLLKCFTNRRLKLGHSSIMQCLVFSERCLLQDMEMEAFRGTNEAKC